MGSRLLEWCRSLQRSSRGHFPDEQAALKVLYLVIRDRQPNRVNPTGRTYNRKEAINSLAGFYGDRVTDF